MNVGRVALASAGALLAWALFFGQGDSPVRLAWIGTGAVCVAALLTAAALDRRVALPRIDRFAAAFAACFAGFVLWQGISIAWSVQPDRSWDYVNRGIAYTAFFTIGLFVASLVPRATRAFAGGLSAVLALVLAYALLAKGIPALYSDYGRVARLRSPVGSWNVLAVVGDFALVLGLWRAAQRRWEGALLVFGSTVAILLTYSRSGVIIAAIVVAAWLVLDGRHFESLLALAVGGGVGAAVVAVSLALPGVTDDKQPHSVRVHDGWLFLVVLVAAAAVVAVSSRALLRRDYAPAFRRKTSLLVAGAIAFACAAAIGAVALHGDGATNASPAGTHCAQGASRFACSSTDARLQWWKEAWQSFEDRPLLGTGAGSFQLAHRLHRAEYTRPVTEPHDLALQALGETGLVGFVLIAGAVGFALLAVRRRLRDGGAALALAICTIAYLAHILIEVGYDFVAVSAPFFTLLGVLLADGDVRPLGRREPLWALGTLLLAASAVVSLAAPYIAQRKVDQAVSSGDPALAAQARDWNPVSVVPIVTQAALEESLGHKLKALQLYRDAVETQPDNPDAWAELGQFDLYARNDACNAYRELDKAYKLDRYNPVVATKGGALDVARARAKAARCRR